jgi:hypothetical protein
VADPRGNEGVKLGVNAAATFVWVEGTALGKINGRSPKFKERKYLIF